MTINDLQHVYVTLHESASPHWFNLGLALGLTHPVLTNIDSKHRGDNVSCLREMLAKLLSTQHVTWSLLSDALKASTVKLVNLADSIMGNHFQCLCSLLYLSFLVLDIDRKLYVLLILVIPFLHAVNQSTTPNLLDRLSLPPASLGELTDVTRCYGNQAGVAHALRAWRRVNPSRATFRALVEITIGLRREDTATDICRFIAKELNKN